jgi:hypothetical protein
MYRYLTGFFLSLIASQTLCASYSENNNYDHYDGAIVDMPMPAPAGQPLSHGNAALQQTPNQYGTQGSRDYNYYNNYPKHYNNNPSYYNYYPNNYNNYPNYSNYSRYPQEENYSPNYPPPQSTPWERSYEELQRGGN